MESTIKQTIKETYTNAVTNDEGCGCGPTCCGPSDLSKNNFAEDYTQLDGYVADADYSLGCGLPTEIANIKESNIVLDLGSGAGNDVFIARRIVGEHGQVYGLDMTEAMIAKANENKKKMGYENVEFVLGEIENIPLPDNSVDVVISNCVMSLVPNKQKAYQEIYRVLKPGGHFSISDVVVKEELPEGIAQAIELYAGCISGASIQEPYLKLIEDQGFNNVLVQKMKEVYLPDNIIQPYMSEEEMVKFRRSHTGVFSMTFSAYK